MYVHYTPNPDGKVDKIGVVSAVAKVMELPWSTSRAVLSFIGSGVEDSESITVMNKYLISSDFERILVKSNEYFKHEEMTVKAFCALHEKGTYMVLTSNRALAVIDGDYYDAYDCGDEIVISYWVK